MKTYYFISTKKQPKNDLSLNPINPNANETESI